MPKRRSMMIGMGALAMGSGAAFSSASFTNSVNSASDMRVVVEENLIVEAGDAFRNDSGYQSDLDPTTDDNKFAGTDHSDFFASDSPTGGNEEDLGSDLSLEDTPAAFVNNQQNNNLVIKLATPLDNNTYTFENVLQVRNDTAESVDVGIKFGSFGVDTSGDQDSNGGTVSESDVVYGSDKGGVYRFEDTSDAQISTDGDHFENNTINSIEDQQVNQTVNIDSGTTEQISLTVDFKNSSIRNSIESASAASGNPFNSIEDTVQLVDKLRFGTI